MPKSRIVERMAFSAEELTAGLKPQNSVLSRDLLTPSRSKAISEKVELDVRMRSSATPVLAVDDLGLCRMQLQAALCQTRLKFDLESLGFLLASAVNQPVISIPTPRKVRMRPRHPEIECVMQEQVRQDLRNAPPEMPDEDFDQLVRDWGHAAEVIASATADVT